MPTGFSGFAWGIAAFCLPILLWPMASLLSTAFAKNPTLSDFQIDLFSIIFWVYPFVLVLIARLLYKLHQYKPKLAVKLLLLSAVKINVIFCVLNVRFNTFLSSGKSVSLSNKDGICYIPFYFSSII